MWIAESGESVQMGFNKMTPTLMGYSSYAPLNPQSFLSGVLQPSILGVDIPALLQLSAKRVLQKNSFLKKDS